jgi:hypothetical protein
VAHAIHDETRILYLGDWDRAGGDIEDNTRRVLERYHGDLADRWERLALTPAQVAAYDLPRILKLDRRDGRERESVETEALSQSVIIRIVRARLDELLPAPLSEFRAREDVERARLRALLGGARGP